MCKDCGCSITTHSPQPSPPFVHHLLADNDARARHNRTHLAEHRVVAINLMSAPGAGKTSLIEATIEAMQSELRIGVLVGDLATENDARRIRAHGVPTLQITTGNACHLDASMIHQAFDVLPLSGIDLLFIENVGNLVCPACFDLGQHRNVVLLSVTEGDDKPAKYPVMFRAADLLLLTKTDLLPYVGDFQPDLAAEAMRDLANEAPIIRVSARNGAGIEAWVQWLREEYTTLRAQDARHVPVHQ